MYVVTNRRLDEDEKGLDLFGKRPSERGPNELRLVKVTRRGKGYQTRVLDDDLSTAQVRALKQDHDLDIDPKQKWHASLAVACELMAELRTSKKHLLIYVHGYNNDMADVMETAEAIEKLYDVIVLPFSWPANGGGALTGTAAYLSDKADARVSMDALNRFIGKVADYHTLLTANQRDKLRAQALKEVGDDNPGAVRERFTQLLCEDCGATLNLLCHSMGNYVLKYATGPGRAASRDLVFDNITLAAADANNPRHEVWVERLQARRRIYVTVNENDFALGWSRRKPGEEQLTRLGSHLKGLAADNASYVDVTGNPHVGNAHGYFTGKPVTKNDDLRRFFATAFEGGRADDQLRYLPDNNSYRIKPGGKKK